MVTKSESEVAVTVGTGTWWLGCGGISANKVKVRGSEALAFHCCARQDSPRRITTIARPFIPSPETLLTLANVAPAGAYSSPIITVYDISPRRHPR